MRTASGIAGVAEHQAMDAGTEDLLDDPVVDLDRRFVEAEDRHGHNHCRRAMPALGRPAVDEAFHELAKLVGGRTARAPFGTGSGRCAV